jgi:ABC-type transport system substrate-binding protein
VQQQGKEEFNRHLVGSGPYRLKDHRPGLLWRFERNPHYSGADGFADEVEVTVGGDAALITMLVERGEMDLGLDYMLTADVVRLQRDPRRRQLLHLLPYAGVDYLFINTEVKPFDRKLVRQAVAHALNRERLVRLSHPYTSARGIIPHNAPWENPELREYDYNPEKARALLREAGLSNGFTTDLWHRPDRGAQLAQAVQEDLRTIGIRANLHVATEAAFYPKCGIRGQVPLGLADWSWDFPDVIADIDPPFNGARIKDADCPNTSFYANSEVDRLILEVDQVFDPAARVRMLRRIEALVVDDVPSVTLNNWRLPVLFSARLRGLKTHPVWRFRLETFWLAP